MSPVLQNDKLRRIRKGALATKGGAISQLDPELCRLATQLAAIQKRAKGLGIFTNERELLQCSGCGLMEDVTASGILITCRQPDLGHDIGLRFKQLNKQTFRCPACGENVTEPLAEREYEDASSA